MSTLQAIRVEGGIFPATLFQRLQADELGDATSRQPSSYHLVGRESIRDAANRSWSYLTGAWEAWRNAQVKEPLGHNSTSAALSRDRWLLVLLNELGYGRVPTRTGGIQVDGDDAAFPVSHLWQHIPIHLLGPGIDLDRRHPGVQGASRAPQAMVQELLNRSDGYLWAVLSNGRRLRLLRDSTALAGSAFVEFDLEAIFDGELFAEFLLLWQTCHVSRLEIRTDGDDALPTDCWLEAWRSDSVKAGSRALDRLRGDVEKPDSGGVANALVKLGTGFLAHPDNRDLREAFHDGSLTKDDYHRHLLRLVYRLLFLFVTEDRGVLLDPSADSGAAARYRAYLSTQRLRRQSRERHGSPAYADLWHAQRLVLTALGGDGEPSLGLPALGGLFDPEQGQGDPLLSAELSNEALLGAIRDLAWIPIGRDRVQPVDYRNLGAEELGSVYEALLELVPQVSEGGHKFELTRLSGNERKTTGSYYTPPGLVSALLDSALDPVIDDAVASAQDNAEAEAKLLALTVCDPACGSGHFLVAAARRIARRLAALRSGEDQPTPDAVRHALRDVISRCIYGVDLNPLAAELAKVSLWLEAMEPGKALGFLDARIRVGNSLLGGTPTVLANGVPDNAFKPFTDGDAGLVNAVRRLNRRERGRGEGSGQDMLSLDFGQSAEKRLSESRHKFLTVHDDAAAARTQARAWRDYLQSRTYRREKTNADAWAAAFAWPFTEQRHAEIAPTSAIVRRFVDDPEAVSLRSTRELVQQVASDYNFFHWHIEFPEIFDRNPHGHAGAEGWTGGFDCIIGNPPWEHIELKEQEYFASRDRQIAEASGATRKNLIMALKTDDPLLWELYLSDKRRIDVLRAFASDSGVYPYTGRGRVKTDSVFAELFRALAAPTGQAGMIVPTGIATDSTTQHFFRNLVDAKQIRALYDFNNSSRIFEGVHREQKFCILVMAGRDRRMPTVTFAFDLEDVREIDARRFALAPEEITLLNPNTGTLPIFDSRDDAEVTLALYRRLPVLVNEAKVRAGEGGGNPWDVTLVQGLFNMTSDSGLFQTSSTATDGDVVPLYEGKLVHLYDHRRASFDADGRLVQVEVEEKVRPGMRVRPRYWVATDLVKEALEGWEPNWLVGFRDTANPENERTAIVSFFPRVAVGNNMPLLFSPRRDQLPLLVAAMSSLVFDFVARRKIGNRHLNFYILKQLPIPEPSVADAPCAWCFKGTVGEWIRARVMELVYTASDMRPFAEDFGDNGEPFIFDAERRSEMRVELDAAMFHLYGANRRHVAHILDDFTVLRDREIAAFGEFRSRTRVLEVFDAMQQAIDTRAEYRTILDPPPGHGPRHEGGARP